MADFVWREGDMAAPITRELLGDGDHAAFDQSNDTVFFRMASLDGGTPKILAAAVWSGEGEVTYAPVWGDTDTPGIFLADFVVHYGDDPSNPESFPNEGYIVIQITRKPGSLYEPAQPNGHDLCTLSDVARYVPAFEPSDQRTLSTLAALITSESELFLEECMREILQSEDERTFVVSAQQAEADRLWIGDLAAFDEVTLNDEAVTPTPLYDGKQFPRRSWEPITSLAFEDDLAEGDLVVVSGTWGFPELPGIVREAVAKRVILRYLNDVADAGDHFSEAIENVNLGALFASSRDALERLMPKRPPFLS